MRIKLTMGEMRELKRLVDQSAGRGGFQNLLLHLWRQLDDESGEIILNYVLLERITRCAFQYDNACWRRTLRRVFRWTLGANLDRGVALR